MTTKLVPLFLAALSLTGCGGGATTIVTTVEVRSNSATAAPTQQQAAPQTTPAPAGASARVGDSLTLDGTDVRMRVTVLDVIDPVSGGNFDEPNGRFVGVRLRLTNVGDQSYSDSPSNGATLVTRGDEQADPTLLTDGDCSSSFSSMAKIAPGSSRVGCIAFDVPSGVGPKTFQFTLNSGFGDQTGEWRVSGARSTANATRPSVAAGAAARPGGGLTACDANISVDPRTTTCAFANNVFYEYWLEDGPSELSAYSPASARRYVTACADGTQIECTTADGALIRFARSAVDAYSQGQADAYAASHDTGP